MSFNAIKYYGFYKSLSRIMAHYCHVIYACYQNMPQNKSNQILFRNNKITFYLIKQQEQYCYVVVTWHVVCRLPVTPKHKLRNDIHIYTYILIHVLICMTADWGNLGSV